MEIKLDFDPTRFLESSLQEILHGSYNVIIPYATGLKILRVLHQNDELANELLRMYKEKQLENGGVVNGENKVSIMETIFFIDSLLRSGYDAEEKSIQRACSFLLNVQKDDGGFPSYVNEKSKVHLTAGL